MHASKTVMADSTATLSNSGLSTEAKSGVIAAATIGGTLILALLLYTLYRRRKGATYSEIIQFRRHSGTIVPSNPSRQGWFSGQPIYRETRYSVHSSRFGSTLSFGKLFKRPSGVPSDVAKRFHRQNPWVQNTWKTENLSPLSSSTTNQVTAPPPRQLVSPEMAQMYTNHYRMTQNFTPEPMKAGPAVSINETVPLEIEPEPEQEPPPEDTNLQTRWSWTNSQAPSTLWRYAPSFQSSLSSLPRFRSVRSWVRGQAERHATGQDNNIDEERAMPSRTTAMPAFKNKASRPNLAPKPTRKLSKRSRATSDFSFSLPIQRETEDEVPMPPLPAKLAGWTPAHPQDDRRSLSTASFL